MSLTLRTSKSSSSSSSSSSNTTTNWTQCLCVRPPHTLITSFYIYLSHFMYFLYARLNMPTTSASSHWLAFFFLPSCTTLFLRISSSPHIHSYDHIMNAMNVIFSNRCMDGWCSGSGCGGGGLFVRQIDRARRDPHAHARCCTHRTRTHQHEPKHKNEGSTCT